MTAQAVTSDDLSELEAQAIVAGFYDAFETAPADRTQKIAEVFAADVFFCDPLHEVVGHQGLGQMAADLNEQFPGARFNRPETVQSHHRQIRFRWTMDDADGNRLIAGHDLLLVGDDGRITHDYSFFE